jgi:hypothetical protein
MARPRTDDRPDPRPGAPPPFAKPGDQLGFARELRRRRKWPPNKAKPWRDDDERHPAATPFLVVPALPGDPGVRPLPGAEALYSDGIHAVDSAGAAVTTPVAGTTYTLRATIRNLGATGAYAGIANFFVASPAEFDYAAATPGATLPAQGRTGFVLLPGQTATIDSPQPWTPGTPQAAASSILVEAFDLLIDTLTHPFDSRADRHVGRRDAVPNFAGTWDGTFTVDGQAGSYLFRVVITQSGPNVNCSFYGQVSGGLPPNPQDSGSGSIVGNQVSMVTIELIGGNPFTTNTWTLSLPDPATLHVTNERVYAPGDGRPTQHWTADLHRI